MARHPSGGGRSPRPGRSGRGRGIGRGGRHYHRKNDTGTARPPPGGVTASVAHQCGGGDTRGGTDAESLLEAVSTLAGQVSCNEPKPRVLCSFVVLFWIEKGGWTLRPLSYLSDLTRRRRGRVLDRCTQYLCLSYHLPFIPHKKMPFRQLPESPRWIRSCTASASRPVRRSTSRSTSMPRYGRVRRTQLHLLQHHHKPMFA